MQKKTLNSTILSTVHVFVWVKVLQSNVGLVHRLSLWFIEPFDDDNGEDADCVVPGILSLKSKMSRGSHREKTNFGWKPSLFSGFHITKMYSI